MKKDKTYLRSLKVFILEVAPLPCAILSGFFVIVSLTDRVSPRRDESLWSFVVLIVFTVLFVALWIYNKFFRKRRRG